MIYYHGILNARHRGSFILVLSQSQTKILSLLETVVLTVSIITLMHFYLETVFKWNHSALHPQLWMGTFMKGIWQGLRDTLINFHPEQRSLGPIKSNQKANCMPAWLFPNVWVFPCPHMAKRVTENSVGWGQKVKICWSLLRSILQEHPIYRQQRFASTWGEIKTTNDWFNDRPCVVSQESPIKKNKQSKKARLTQEKRWRHVREVQQRMREKTCTK